MPAPKNGNTTSSQRFAASALAAGCAETLTLPIDVTKVRLQTSFFSGVSSQLQVGRLIVESEGIAALWKGLAPALVRQMSYTGLSLVLYEPMRDFIAGDVAPKDLPFWKRVLAGGSAGATSIYVMNWSDVLKARMQNSPVRLSFYGTFREIYASSGIGGFWKGSVPNVCRCFVGNACELACYDQFKMLLCTQAQCDGNSILTHFGASTGAGFVSAIFSTPVDVLKTRLQVFAGLTNDSLFSLALRIPREEGFFAFYEGFWPLLQRKVLWTVAFFCCYEKFSTIYGQLFVDASSSSSRNNTSSSSSSK